MAKTNSPRTHITTFNALIILFATLGSLTYGYCTSIIATTLGQPTFLSYIGLDTASNATQLVGAINGLYQAGGLLGTIFVGVLGDWLGRKHAIFLSACLCVIGGALQTGSVHIGMFMVARLVTGFSIGALVTLIPLWQSEMAPAETRGLLVGLHGVFILIGYTIASWVGVGFYYVNANGAQWRIPLALQMIFPLALAAGVWFLPESPRWLIEKGRSEESLAILKRIHGNSVVEREFKQMSEQIELERTLPSSWASIITVPSYRRRALIGFACMFFAQGTGTQVINNYGPTLYKSLGYGQAQQLMLSAGWITVGIFANVLDAILLDRVGRKLLMTIGMALTGMALLGETILLAVASGSRAGSAAAVAFLYLHICFYGSTLDASTYVYASEIWPTHLRARGCAISTSGLFVSSLIFLISASDAFAAIGWKYYLVFLSMTVVGVFVFAFFFPETGGISLEEIAATFGDQVVGVQLDAIEGGDNDIEQIVPNFRKKEEAEDLYQTE